jgi:hypothetical protein
MRWTIRLGAALALLWVAYAISPYVAAYRLAAAVQARDVEAIKTRVNFRAVRLSLAKQILAIYLTTTGGGGTSEATAHQLASAAVEIAEPLMAQLLSPEVLLDLLDDGWPQSIVAEKPADAPVPGHAGAPPASGAPQPVQPARIGLGSPRLTWRDLLVMVDTRGFRKFYLTLPGALGPESRVRLYFRFGPWFWRLYGVELPTTLARRLADELRKRIGRRH